MSFRSSTQRGLLQAREVYHHRLISTSRSQLYPRITSNRFSSPQDQVGAVEEPEPSPSSSSSGKIRFPVTNYDGPDYDPRSALEKAKENAWYLEEEETERPVSSEKASPIFTTFDPDRTTTSASSFKITPLPPSAPREIEPLYDWLIGDDAAHVLDVGSIKFFKTTEASLDSTGGRDMVNIPGGDVGANWDWIVVAVVKGRGKGVVGRAERALRTWLHNNPLAGTPPKPAGVSNKLPRTPDWTDWSMVQIPHLGISVNLFTAEGRDRWDLEGVWKEADEELLIGGRSRPFGYRPAFASQRPAHQPLFNNRPRR